ncbi:septation ring formation regulator EzrA [Listeria fleischmannii]|uniref:Septation ring formation regulator EzrA n=2 Tax=Listeria fleischmannii TaxID=1069827 RepID=A0A841YB57_9LIST|nr:septation ring formation regulator EzrA [Listeria fleischmannii]MBC1397505.1 septation ring formation regulator EzrA [Listeria fleischmannii]MBC1425874.1 septation ring formation regulator EzrA [Listeria fleischmannii]STY35107.1 Septation ring formation regulator EzrA [Listeria fleischmannii subsp. coloradonensis]
MFYYILIAFIIIVIALFGTGYLLKKKHYTRINTLEEQKLALRERPVIEELSKVKKLKLTGQTEKLFESWRSSWDEIETRLFPDVEEVLMEAEMNTDKYRFGTATQNENDLEQMLVTIDRQMNQILNGLKELLTSEEKNAKESRATKEKLAEMRRIILTQGFKLGGTLPRYEAELNEAADKINRYDDLTDQGDHLEAREIIISAKKDLELLEDEMDKTPKLLHETETVLPDELADLKQGYLEMVNSGYFLEQLEFEKEHIRLSEQVKKANGRVLNGELSDAETLITEIHTEINLFYDTLEQEVHAKSFVSENRAPVSDKLEAQMELSAKLAEQITEVKETYHISEEELANYLETSAALAEQKENFSHTLMKLNEQKMAYSVIQDALKEIDERLLQIAIEQDKIGEDLRSLRKDEIEAREDVERMKRQIVQLNRKIERARLPGVPTEYRELETHMYDALSKMEESLGDRPLKMKTVSKNWQTAKEDLEHISGKATEIVENAALVESVIQYANRYRMDDKELDEELVKAEQHFYKDFQYKKALEIAVTALEKVEVGAFKKIEKAFSEE